MRTKPQEKLTRAQLKLEVSRDTWCLSEGGAEARQGTDTEGLRSLAVTYKELTTREIEEMREGTSPL